ncbi:hypothetical protein [Klebsiella quasipneumoniae]|uniref:Uncharacterized protein n=1 Tax=Klebsiella quasipneumoniae TaxID=1463165 RepID=A0ABD7N1R3_9ENTR|nr:hypothetical protein [Klebsiella quasipneumoniae]SSF74233.1 Uncharacterised protein [Klebsiella quasipneumoniae]
MTITLQAVNELIQSLESAGELSIREQKFLKLAKEFRICSASLDTAIKTGNVLADQNAQLAAENVALKSKGKELLGEACAVYSRLNKLIDPSIGDFVDGQTLHEFQFVLDVETPATDRIVAGIKADGVEEFVSNTVHKIFDESGAVSALAYLSLANSHVKQLREWADK